MANDITKQIEELTERQKELVLTKHNLLESIERAESFRDQLRQAEKEITWIAGALEVLKKWEAERKESSPEPEMAAAGGWGKG